MRLHVKRLVDHRTLLLALLAVHLLLSLLAFRMLLDVHVLLALLSLLDVRVLLALLALLAVFNMQQNRFMLELAMRAVCCTRWW